MIEESHHYERFCSDRTGGKASLQSKGSVAGLEGSSGLAARARQF
jgi:hypothetical protein